MPYSSHSKCVALKRYLRGILSNLKPNFGLSKHKTHQIICASSIEENREKYSSRQTVFSFWFKFKLSFHQESNFQLISYTKYEVTTNDNPILLFHGNIIHTTATRHKIILRSKVNIDYSRSVFIVSHKPRVAGLIKLQQTRVIILPVSAKYRRSELTYRPTLSIYRSTASQCDIRKALSIGFFPRLPSRQLYSRHTFCQNRAISITFGNQAGNSRHTVSCCHVVYIECVARL